MIRYYVLDSDHAVRGPVGLAEYARWYEAVGFDGTRVARDAIEGDPTVEVSTVFLGLDHNHAGTDVPIIFETMIFDGEWDGYQWRWSTWNQAVSGHARVVFALRAGQSPEEVSW